MRSLALALSLVLVMAACSDDDSAATTSSGPSTTAAGTTSSSAPSTTTTTSSSTTTTAPPPVAVASLCVIGRAPGETVEVRSGVGDSFDVLGQLPHDATGVGTTGVSATNDADEEWTEIVHEGTAGWVRSQYVTGGPCDVGESALWAVVDIVCESVVNVRDGQGDGYDILGTLEPDAFDVVGTGITALDDQDRTWVQIEFEGGTAWVAGWFLTTDPGPTIECSIPEFPWTITANAFGPIEFGDLAADLEDITGFSWSIQDANNDCEWFTNADQSIGVQAIDGVIVEMWAMSADVAITPEGFQVGQSKVQAGITYPGRAVLLPGPFAGTNVVIDGASYADNWTYLFIEDPFDEDLVGTIRINDDGGYIEGGCS